MDVAEITVLNVARVVVGIALGILGSRCAVLVLQHSRPLWERMVFGALLIMLIGQLVHLGELWDEPLRFSGLPVAALVCALLATAWYLRYHPEGDGT